MYLTSVVLREINLKILPSKSFCVFFSDDRSAELFKNKLETTTQMKACMGEGNKPNCLIIDEIDGAPVVIIVFLSFTF